MNGPAPNNLRKHKHFCRFPLGPNRKSVVEKANGQSACNTSDRPDRNDPYEEDRVANAHPIFAPGFCCNPVYGGLRN